MKKVSVIIPVFNSEMTLNRCIDSLLSQTIKDIEIILVDDGSSDGSSKICDEYASNDRRVRAIHKNNGGLVSARKAGVKAAKGDYVGYVDSDDWVEPEMYESLRKIADRDNADMVCSGYIMEGGYISKEYDNFSEGCYTNDGRKDLLEKMIFDMNIKDLGLRRSLCCKLFRRSILERVQDQIPDEVSYAEDMLCTLTFALNCNSISVVKKGWYHYIINNTSMTQAPNTDYLSRVNAVYQHLCLLYDHPDFTDNMRMQAELYVTQLLIKGINSRMGFSVKNLMWIDSEWMFKVPVGSRILLCGSGALRDTYARQIENSDRLKPAGEISDPKDATGYEYDYIVITYKYAPKAEEIKKELIEAGVLEDKILWFEQKEIFWKYAEDAGLC